MAYAASLPRRVEPEDLDALPADDPQARRSRADLRRIHRAMATLSILLRAFDRAAADAPPRRILELGCGDGSLMLRLARKRAARWPGVEVTLLDRLDLVDADTIAGFRALGWTPRVVAMDVFAWLQQPRAEPWDLVVANLFLHHFDAGALDGLLAGAAARGEAFFCCEPRRARLPLLASHLVALLGAGAVTRKDAVLSVRAGFRGRELSERWPDPPAWRLQEGRAGLFGHGLLAMRRNGQR